MSQVLKRQSCAVAAKSSENSDAPGPSLGVTLDERLVLFHGRPYDGSQAVSLGHSLVAELSARRKR